MALAAALLAVKAREAPSCARLETSGVYDQIYRDLERYANLDVQRLAMYDGFCLRRQKACIRLRIQQGSAYVLDMFPGFQSRHRATLLGIFRALGRLPPLPDLE
ncbi:unnamed protein product, partial [Effrenium voratum]